MSAPNSPVCTTGCRAWAERTVRRARAFGVAAEGIRLVDLLAAGPE